MVFLLMTHVMHVIIYSNSLTMLTQEVTEAVGEVREETEQRIETEMDAIKQTQVTKYKVFGNKGFQGFT